MMIQEPARRSKEEHDIGTAKRDGSPFWLVLSIPTMCWIIASGTLHNFNMYAIGGFLPPYLMRMHGINVQVAGWISMAVYGLAGVPGMMLGGLMGDWIIRRQRNGRMLLAAIAIAISAPLMFLALGQPEANWIAFSLLFGLGCALMYAYYATVYTTIQDVIEPSLRATAMALYFCAMYLLGGALGPMVIGSASDYFAVHAAEVNGHEFQSLPPAEQRPYRVIGINRALSHCRALRFCWPAPSSPAHAHRQSRRRAVAALDARKLTSGRGHSADRARVDRHRSARSSLIARRRAQLVQSSRCGRSAS